MTDIFLRQGDATPTTIILRDPTQADAGGTINYTLDGSAGSYAYAGQSASFTWARGVAGSAGSYAYSGQSASFTWGRLLGGSAGSYAYTGQAATMAVARLLSGSAGAYTYSGQTASFTLARQLAGNAGAYAYSGQDAALTYAPGVTGIAYALDGAAGAYAYAGQMAELTYAAGGVQPAWEYGYPFFYPDPEMDRKRALRKRITDEDEADRKRKAEEKAAAKVIEQVAQEQAAFVQPPRIDLLKIRLEAENLAYRKAYAAALRAEHVRQHAALMVKLERDSDDEEALLMLY